MLKQHNDLQKWKYEANCKVHYIKKREMMVVIGCIAMENRRIMAKTVCIALKNREMMVIIGRIAMENRQTMAKAGDIALKNRGIVAIAVCIALKNRGTIAKAACITPQNGQIVAKTKRSTARKRNGVPKQKGIKFFYSVPIILTGELFCKGAVEYVDDWWNANELH